MPYVLEVQKFNPTGHISYPEWHGKSEHIGYMNKLFTPFNISNADYFCKIAT